MSLLDPPPFRPPLKVTASGLTATVGPGSVQDAGGTTISFAGGTLALAANSTNHIFISLLDGSLQGSSRPIHQGGIYVGKVVTGASSVAAGGIVQPASFTVPGTCLPRLKRKVDAALPITCYVFGDSITDGHEASGSAFYYTTLLFGAASNTYSVPSLANWTTTVMGLSGAGTIWGLACAADIVVGTKAVTPANHGGGIHRTAELNALCLVHAVSATVAAGGTGYTVGDTLTVSTDFGSVNSTWRVATVSVGVVTAVTVVNSGSFVATSSNPHATTGGTGSGCTLTITYDQPAAGAGGTPGNYFIPVGKGLLKNTTPDLVVFALGTNAGDDTVSAAYLESAIRIWLEQGSEVLVVTGNRRYDGGPVGFVGDAAQVQAICDATGAALADTVGAMDFQRSVGNSVYNADLVHPTNLGHAVWARTIREVLNTTPQPGGAVKSVYPVTFRSDTRWMIQGSSVDIQFQEGNGSTGARATSGRPDVNPACLMAGFATAAGNYGLTVGQKFVGAHTGCSEIYLITELPNGTSANYSIVNTVGTLATGTITGAGIPMLTRVLATATLEAAASSQQARSNGGLFEFCGWVTPTSLTGAASLPIIGFLYVTPKRTLIRYTAQTFAGSGWATEACRDEPYKLQYTDTVGDSVTFTAADCDGFQVVFQTGSQSGTVEITIDGERFLTGYPLEGRGYNTMPIFLNYSFLPAIWRARGAHTVKITLMQAGAAPVAYNRSMAIHSVYALKYRS